MIYETSLLARGIPGYCKWHPRVPWQPG